MSIDNDTVDEDKVCYLLVPILIVHQVVGESGWKSEAKRNQFGAVSDHIGALPVGEEEIKFFGSDVLDLVRELVIQGENVG